MTQVSLDDIEGWKRTLIQQGRNDLTNAQVAAHRFSDRKITCDDLEYEEYDHAISEFNKHLHSYLGIFGKESAIATSDQFQLLLKMTPPKFGEWLQSVQPHSLGGS